MGYGNGWLRWLTKFDRLPILAAFCLTTLFASCSQFGDAGPVAEAPQLPTLPPELSKECPDPGVDRNAIVALLEHREAWADCRKRHQNLVEYYDDLADGLGNRSASE